MFKRFEKCRDCQNKMNDDYCLYCIHNYDLLNMRARDIRELRDYYKQGYDSILLSDTRED